MIEDYAFHSELNDRRWIYRLYWDHYFIVHTVHSNKSHESKRLILSPHQPGWNLTAPH